jgi:hypothetical protein
MAGNPRENIEKINAVINAWETLRPDKTYSGMTLAQFKAKVQPSIDARVQIDVIENRVIAAQNQRDDADKASIATVQLVVNAVRGDPEDGEDSELYEAMGYVRKSERSSGLHRAKVSAAAKT